MLNIPDSVKALFKRDGVQKNFRVHFPNGELSDLTNENVVQESVKFTESLCSQDVLKFGLTESSVIEFETVGVSNIYGMIIECGIEIDLSSLSAGDLATIAAGTWDGTYVAAGDSDIGYGYFRIPYGTFRVESCPRDHQAMTHRKVTAYTLSAFQVFMNPFETAKLNVFYAGNKYKPNLYLLMLSFLGWKDNSFILDEGYTVGSAISTRSTDPISGNSYKTAKSVTVSKVGGGTLTFDTTIYWNLGYNKTTSVTSIFTLKMEELYTLDKNYLTDSNINSMLNDIADALEALGTIDLDASGYDSWLELAKDFCSDDDGNITIYPGFTYLVYYRSGTNAYSAINNTFYFTEDNKAIYPLSDESTRGGGKMPYVGGSGTENNVYGYFRLPFRVNILQGITTVYNNNWSAEIPEVKIYERVAPIPTNKLLVNSTLQTVISPSTLYAFPNSYSALDLVNGWLELRAKFGKVGRDGDMDVFGLSTSSPVSVIPGEYIEFWWDEYDVDKIGTVKYTFTNSNEEECEGSYKFGKGTSVYDMSGNASLDAMELGSETLINALLLTNFTPHLNPVTFTPIDLKMKGLPYLEAGDYLAVTAEDGTVANSFAMRIELEGIQFLTANIVSSSGEIIDSEV